MNAINMLGGTWKVSKRLYEITQILENGCNSVFFLKKQHDEKNVRVYLFKFFLGKPKKLH